MHLYVHCSIIYNSQDLEAAQVSISKWVDKKKLWYIYTMEYYSDIKKKEILPFLASWMELANIMLYDISQSKKDKYHVIPLTSKIQWTK